MIKLKSWLEKQEFMDLKGLKDGLEEALKSDLKDSVNALRLVLLLPYGNFIDSVVQGFLQSENINLRAVGYGCHQSAFVDRYKNLNERPYRW